MHAERAAHVDFAGGRQQIIAHHAHDRARHYPEIFFHRGPALYGTDLDVGLLHPVVDHVAKLGHLDQSRIGDVTGAYILPNLRQLGLHT